MAEPPESPASERAEGRGPIAAHPVTSAVIALLLVAAVAGTLIVPVYARTTPRVGDFPFFYFYLLAYMPAVAVALWLVELLQRRLGKGGPAR